MKKIVIDNTNYRNKKINQDQEITYHQIIKIYQKNPSYTVDKACKEAGVSRAFFYKCNKKFGDSYTDNFDDDMIKHKKKDTRSRLPEVILKQPKKSLPGMNQSGIIPRGKSSSKSDKSVCRSLSKSDKSTTRSLSKSTKSNHSPFPKEKGEVSDIMSKLNKLEEEFNNRGVI